LHGTVKGEWTAVSWLSGFVEEKQKQKHAAQAVTSVKASLATLKN
jgi:hypothetical protein